MSDHEQILGSSLRDTQPGSADSNSQWRPIETAPKDGTRMLAVDTARPDGTEVLAFDPNPKARFPWKVGSRFGRAAWSAPTHWMPLPAAPAINTTAGGAATGFGTLHPETADLVDRFAAALKEKLARAEAKYGYSDGWLADDWHADLVRDLAHHVQKGDPRDVAAYCAFAWHHGWPTTTASAGRDEAAQQRSAPQTPDTKEGSES